MSQRQKLLYPTYFKVPFGDLHAGSSTPLNLSYLQLLNFLQKKQHGQRSWNHQIRPKLVLSSFLNHLGVKM